MFSYTNVKYRSHLVGVKIRNVHTVSFKCEFQHSDLNMVLCFFLNLKVSNML